MGLYTEVWLRVLLYEFRMVNVKTIASWASLPPKMIVFRRAILVSLFLFADTCVAVDVTLHGKTKDGWTIEIATGTPAFPFSISIWKYTDDMPKAPANAAILSTFTRALPGVAQINERHASLSRSIMSARYFRYVVDRGPTLRWCGRAADTARL